ncbi:hypothetical protein FQR65_LT01149 [Abscondita terminalis]|nr:hypothetical protein FQR65_LT01149 [Abscondita terminalis]
MHKLVVFCTLNVIAFAFPQIPSQFNPQNFHYPYAGVQIPILAQNQDVDPASGYQWSFASANGINAEESGTIIPLSPDLADKQVRGSYNYVSLEGIPVSVTYYSDATGFHPQVMWFALVALAAADVSHLFKSKHKNIHRKPFQEDYNDFVPHLQHYPDYINRLSGYNDHAVPIIQQHQNIESGGSYEWRFATANGIAAEEVAIINGENSDRPTKTVRGSYQYTSPDGVPVLVTYIADENGFQPQVITNEGSAAYGVLPDFYKMPIKQQ